MKTRTWLRLGGLSLLVVGMPMMLWMAEPGAAASLPEPRTDSDRSLEETIQQRRSVRSYGDQPLSDEQIAQLCWAAQGITEPRRGLRASPSAGATYPLELYVATADGLFHYIIDQHKLSQIKENDVRPALRAAALDQYMVEQAPAVFIIAADVRRTAQRYGARAERYVMMEVGHAGQNLLLQAVALDLVAVPIGAFDDDATAKALDLPRALRPLYLIPVGHPR